jgi:hypothetical protein
VVTGRLNCLCKFETKGLLQRDPSLRSERMRLQGEEEASGIDGAGIAEGGVGGEL